MSAPSAITYRFALSSDLGQRVPLTAAYAEDPPFPGRYPLPVKHRPRFVLGLLSASSCLMMSLVLAGCGEAPPEPAGGAVQTGSVAPEEEDLPAFTEGVNQMEITLYFLRPDGEGLAPERRRVFRTTTVVDRARQALQALFDGPEGNLIASVPPNAELLELFVAGDGTAYVDLGPEILNGIGTGTSDAVYAIYAIVNTLAMNFDEIKKVKILVDGDEAGEVGGHFDFSHPILPEMGLVAGSRAALQGGFGGDPAAATITGSPPVE